MGDANVKVTVESGPYDRDARAALLSVEVVMLRARVAKLEAAAEEITENEMDGYGNCRYCGSTSYPVDEAGVRITTENVEHAAEWHVDHDPECPSAILDKARQ